MNVNKVVLVGRVTRDPEIRTTPSGQSVATLSLATNSFWTDKSGTKQEKTEFHNIVLWGKLSEIAGQYLTRGQECFIEGRLQTREYTAKDGTTRRTTEIIAENLQLGNRSNTQGQGTSRGPVTNTPQKQNTPQTRAQAPASVEEEIPTINLDDEQEEIKIEDVPF